MPVHLVRLIIYVRDVAKLKSFYTEKFDLAVIEEIKDEWVVFKAGAIEFALHLVGEKYRKCPEDEQGERLAELPVFPKKAGSNTKFVFAIELNLQAHREKMVAAGVMVGNLKRYEGFPYQMYDGCDPEGNIFQVMRFD